MNIPIRWRIVIVVAGAWLLFVLSDSFFHTLYGAKSGFRLDRFVENGALPVAIIVGAIWVIEGIVKRRKRCRSASAKTEGT